MTFHELRLPDGAVYRSGDGPPDVQIESESWDRSAVKGVLIAKSSDELRYTLTMGYPAYSLDAAVARDGHLDFASIDEVRKAAWHFLENPDVGLRHEDGTEGAGRIVESFLWPDDAPDWHRNAVDGSEVIIKSGDWLIGTVWGEDAWNLIKSGEIRGTSMQGRADRRTPNPADVAKVLNAKRRAN